MTAVLSQVRQGALDLQVNGYGGVDFNQDALTAADLEQACELLLEHNVAGVLATIITERVEQMETRLSNLARLREASSLASEIIFGIHIEGPFISAEHGYVGAHPPDAVRPADRDTMQRLLDAAGGLTRLVTLAPEQDPGFKVTKMLAEARVTVSAGHCNPSLDQLDGAIDAGLSMFTHLGNGAPMQLHRHDNIIQRALSRSDRLYLCFIADGVHVPLFALSNYIRSAGVDRCIAVTDAIAPAGLGPGRYTVSRWELDIGEDMVAWAPDHSHFVGSAVTMPQVVRNLSQYCGLPPDDVRQLTDTNPRRAVSA